MQGHSAWSCHRGTASPLQQHRPRVPSLHPNYARRGPRHARMHIPGHCRATEADGAKEAWFGINFYEVLKVRLAFHANAHERQTVRALGVRRPLSRAVEGRRGPRAKGTRLLSLGDTVATAQVSEDAPTEDIKRAYRRLQVRAPSGVRGALSPPTVV
jgi:hypothetical protein